MTHEESDIVGQMFGKDIITAHHEEDYDTPNTNGNTTQGGNTESDDIDYLLNL